MVSQIEGSDEEEGEGREEMKKEEDGEEEIEEGGGVRLFRKAIEWESLKSTYLMPIYEATVKDDPAEQDKSQGRGSNQQLGFG